MVFSVQTRLKSQMSSADAAISTLKQDLRALNEKKETLERSVKEALSLLESTSVGVHGKLVDADGFPLENVDHYSIRDARHTVATGVNDLKAIDEQLHEKLRQLHEIGTAVAATQMHEDEVLREQKRREAATKQLRLKLENDMGKLTPFLRVADVAHGSPAASCGLQSGDTVVDFGGFRRENFQAEALEGLGKRVRDGEGSVTSVWIMRVRKGSDTAGNAVSQILELPLVPQRWRGDGLTGCAFEPI